MSDGLLTNLARTLRQSISDLNPEWTPEAQTKLGSTLLDFAPVIGGVKGAREEWQAGNPSMAAFNAATVPLDLATFGAGGAAAKMAVPAIAAIFASRGAKISDVAKMAQPEILDGEIAAARAAAAPRDISLPNGIQVRATPSFSPLGGAVTGISYETPTYRVNFPQGYIPHNHPMWNGMTNEQRAAFTDQIRSMNSAKRDLIEWKDARDYVMRKDAVPVAKAESAMQHADANWWRNQLKIGGPNAIEEFLRAAAQKDEFFLYGRGPQGSDASKIIQHFSEKSGVPLRYDVDGRNLVISNPKTHESMSINNFSGDRPVINSIGMMAGSGSGKPAYQAAYQILAGEGKKAYPDTGLTAVNDFRKLGNVMAGELRAGRPVAVQNSSKVGRDKSIGAQFLAEAMETRDRAPAAMDLSFDGERFTLLGKAADDAAIANHLGNDAFKKSVGVMTAKRSAMADYLNGLSIKEASELGGKWSGGALFPSALIAAPVAAGLLGVEDVTTD